MGEVHWKQPLAERVINWDARHEQANNLAHNEKVSNFKNHSLFFKNIAKTRHKTELRVDKQTKAFVTLVF